MSLSLQYNEVFKNLSIKDFSDLSLKAYRYQFEKNEVYRIFSQAIGRSPETVKNIDQIPFLPIGFFKNHIVTCGKTESPIVFSSSGTTGSELSRHYVSDINWYLNSLNEGFKYFFGNPDQYHLLALLPSYLERPDSSLVYMIKELLKQTTGGFYLNNLNDLRAEIENPPKGKQVFLIGVTFALLDLIETTAIQSPANIIIMETGGMKGRRKEIVREELHEKLTKGFGVERIYSEYGMTELLSQGYSKGNGIFNCPPWMKILVRDVYDPLANLQPNKTGAINIIDLANINSCCFIATQDLGKINNDGSFEITGRFDNSNIRGCNLMLS